ncbi:MAG: hypothetical protein KAR20_23830, partial [Candidatus Heimdallarchaeota archaeon]|nr:hypothetical protein [Candidatus Heimdallarchaeota archaeon]
MVRPPDSRDLCIRCKGSRLLCGRPKCSILQKIRATYPIIPLIKKQEISGASPPSVFVGWHGYPKVSVGPLVPPFREDTAILDDPESWFGKSMDEIISFRSSLIRSSFDTNVYSATQPSTFLENTQEVAMAD